MRGVGEKKRDVAVKVVELGHFLLEGEEFDVGVAEKVPDVEVQRVNLAADSECPGWNPPEASENILDVWEKVRDVAIQVLDAGYCPFLPDPRAGAVK